ncbi:synaptonemal complex protein 3-like isoform X4 [Biomphalaria glabrata]|uniref:Synaptonemal complex protein 3-like isoform X4 n=1 Tax=Biomphalaria glabrata TaxID=6526 RepID=A0A9W3BNH3_BIOGL|nr:synaptonemal complex protein 3-like isoform X4 [Biomphalaria glabrata]
MPKAKKGECPSNNKRIIPAIEDYSVLQPQDQSDNSRSIDSPIRDDQDVDLTATEPEQPLMNTKTAGGKKRVADNDYDPAEFSHEMQKMLEGFKADISKTHLQKKKRLEQLTQASLKNANKKVDEIWKNQQILRERLQEEFSKQVFLVYQQWESDIEKSKEQEEKLNGLDDLERNRLNQQELLQSELKKEMQLLQKRILMDTQQHEMANVRKSLHSMLY